MKVAIRAVYVQPRLWQFVNDQRYLDFALTGKYTNRRAEQARLVQL